MAKLTLSDVANIDSNPGSAAATINANWALIEAALENTLSRDGTAPNTMSAALDMNSNSITNLPTPTLAAHAATKGYVDGIVAGGSLPDQTGNAGKYLTTDGAAASWAVLDALPAQATHTDALLKTDGSVASWVDYIRINSNNNLFLGDTMNQATGANGTFHMQNAAVAPAASPVGGGILYTLAGALRYRGTSGAAAVVVNADGTLPSSSPWTQAGINLHYDGGDGTDIGLGTDTIPAFTAVATGVMIGDGSAITGRSAGGSAGWLDLMNNQFFNGANHEYIANGYASKIQLASWDNGRIRFYVSPNGTAGGNAETGRIESLLLEQTTAGGVVVVKPTSSSTVTTPQLQISTSATGFWVDASANMGWKAYADAYIYTGASPTLGLTVDANQNVGVGLVPETSWDSSYSALQFGAFGAIVSHAAAGGAQETIFSHNTYYDGVGWKYILGDYALHMLMDGPDIIFKGAASGSPDAAISFTELFRISYDQNAVSLNKPVIEDWDATLTAIEIGGNASISAPITAGATKRVDFAQNGYFDNIGWKYQDSDWASRYSQVSGRHIFRHSSISGTADNAITWVESLEIDQTGHLLVRNNDATHGSATAPTIQIGSGQTGFYLAAANSIGLTCNGAIVTYTSAAGFQMNAPTNGAAMLNEAPSATNPVFSFVGDTTLGIGRHSANSLSLISASVESVRVDNNAAAGNTRLMVYDVDNATLERVTVGAADSGGAGFKVLRIPN